MLDVIRKAFKKRYTSERAQKDQGNLSGWRDIGGGGLAKRGQYGRKDQEEGNPKVSLGNNETNLEE